MSTSYPPGSRDTHEKFCHKEDWALVQNARGKKVGHHVTFELALHDGRILRTRISRPVDRSTYGPSMWGAIFKDQLEVTPSVFWGLIDDGILPDRGAPDGAVPKHATPLYVVDQLIRTAGIPEQTVADMTKEEALQALAAYWADQAKLQAEQE